MRPRKVAGDRRALSAATDKCETFLETKKGFLARLEAFFVSTADERWVTEVPSTVEVSLGDLVQGRLSR